LEIANFLGKYLNKGHREFGVPGFFYKKPWLYVFNCPCDAVMSKPLEGQLCLLLADMGYFTQDCR